MRGSRLAKAALSLITSAQKRLSSSVWRAALLTLLALPITAAYTAGFSHSAQAAPRADDLSVVGPPSLDKMLVDAIFHRLHSPMEGNGAVIYALSAQNHVDDAFALAVWWTETNDGAAGTGRPPAYNPGGVKNAKYPQGSDGYSLYTDYAQAASDWFTVINQRYVSQGLTTIYQISHPYVGTSTSSQWAAKVVNLMAGYQEEAKQSPAYLAAHDPPNLLKTPAPDSEQPTKHAEQSSSPPAHTSQTSLGVLFVGLVIVLISLAVVFMLHRSLRKTKARAAPSPASKRAIASRSAPFDNWQPQQPSPKDDDWEDLSAASPSAGAAASSAQRERPSAARPVRLPPLRSTLPARPIVRNRLVPVKPGEASEQFTSRSLRHYLPGDERGNHQTKEQE